MPEVTVEVGGKSYRLRCGEGEEGHLMALAARVDGEAARLGQLGSIPEARLMLMSALMLADRLSETEAALRAAERRAVEAERMTTERSDGPETERQAEVAASIDALAARIESLAERVEEGV